MPKRKLTPEQRARRAHLKATTMFIFVGGRQKRVKRPPTIDGVDIDTFIRQNADEMWLHMNEQWEDIHGEDRTVAIEDSQSSDDDDIPF